ncbi:MAG: hypothetical protein U1A24_03910 [Cypionkella sp.]|uniref:hypothetical protein n=1 Tax=Cypionkella sp. TaxID=2811411 RepID=UPI002ABC129D|nr:hypothetical protein [Cypionkella sp.]MDZ4309690.1 hypothetical protein [Cypionkella sp.]MDZ4394681.1 hypothetical protein [Cypionkella sp.]
MKRLLTFVVVIALAVLGAGGYRYYAWVNNTAGEPDPFDEVGIDLHQMMPGFVQDWGCGKLKENFGDKTLPPYGCQSDTQPGKWQ